MQTPWNTQSPAKRYLDALSPADLSIKLELALVGDDHLRWTGEAVEVLGKQREAVIVRRLGTFAQAGAGGYVDAYLAAVDAMPTVQSVLNERFGNPAIYGRFADSANAAHRADPWAIKRECDAWAAAAAERLAA